MLPLEFIPEVNTEAGKCISIYHYHNAGHGQYYYRNNSFSFFSQKSFKYLAQIRSMACLWGICFGNWHWDRRYSKQVQFPPVTIIPPLLHIHSPSTPVFLAIYSVIKHHRKKVFQEDIPYFSIDNALVIYTKKV